MKYILVGSRDQVLSLKLLTKEQADELLSEYPKGTEIRIVNVLSSEDSSVLNEPPAPYYP